MNIQEFRAEYPQYDDIGDEELARSLHAKNYSDIPYDDFAQRFGVQQQPQAEPPGMLESIARGAGQGATVGWGDELSAMLSAGAQMLADPASISGQQYYGARERLRSDNAAAQEANSGSYLGGEILGSLAIPGAAGARLAGTGGRQLARLSGVGAAEGGAYGAGLSEGDTAGEVLTDAAQGAGLGALAAPAVAGAVKGVSKVGAGVFNALRRKIMSSPEDTAKRAVRKALEDDQITAQQADELLEAHPDLRIGDLGPNTKDLGRVAGNMPGGGTRIATENLTGRQLGQQARIDAAAREGIGDKFGDYYDFVDNIIAERSRMAKPMYDEAYEVAITPTENMVRISKTPSFQAAAKRAQQNLGNELDLIGGGGLGDAGMMSTRFMDLIKREMDDAIDTARRAGKGNEARQLTAIKKEFVDELDAQNPAYQKARSTFAGASALKDAAELGKTVFVGNKDPRLIQRATADMSEGELESFRVGVLDSLMTRVQLAGGTHNAVKRVVGSTRAQKLIEEVFPDEKSYQKFMDTLDAESMMTDTFQRVTQGSRTAPMTMQKDAFDEAMGMGGALASDIATQGAPGAAVAVKAAKKMFGETLGEAEYEEISKLLFGHLPADARSRLFGRFMGFEPSKIPAQVGRLSTGPASLGAGAMADQR